MQRFFVRHAKSSWDDIALADKDRPLAPRGERALPKMIKQLQQWIGDVSEESISVYSSDAIRAIQTANVITQAFPNAQFTLLSQLYMASDLRWLQLLDQYPQEPKQSKDHCQIWVGHNPGLHQLIERLSGQHFEKFPTAAISFFNQQNSCNQTMKLWTPKGGRVF